VRCGSMGLLLVSPTGAYPGICPGGGDGGGAGSEHTLPVGD